MNVARQLSVSIALLLAFTSASKATAQGADPERQENPLLLSELVAAVLEARPDLQSFEAQASARRAEAVAAGALPDPMIGLALNDVVAGVGGRENPMSMREVMVTQRLPWPGKRRLRSEVAEILAGAAEAGREARELALIEATTAAYVDLWLALESRSVILRQKETLGQLSELARVRFETLAVRLSDPLRAELALIRVEEPLAELEEREEIARGVLASLLARPHAPPTGTPAPLPELEAPEDLESLIAAVDRHPALRELGARAESRRAAGRLAEREVFPDIDVTVAYGQRDLGSDMFGVRLMAPIPLFGRGRRDQEAQAARADARYFEGRAEEQRLELWAEARSIHAEASRADRVARLFAHQVLPIARENVEAATAAYEAGDADFLTLLDAELQVFDHELRLLRARAQQAKAAARLNRVLGRGGVAWRDPAHPQVPTNDPQDQSSQEQ